jgi:hypothetical protein
MSDFIVYTYNGFGTTSTSKCTTKTYCPGQENNPNYQYGPKIKTYECVNPFERTIRCDYFNKNVCNTSEVNAINAYGDLNTKLGKCTFNTNQFDTIDKIKSFQNADFVKDASYNNAFNIMTENVCTQIINNGDMDLQCSNNIVGETPSQCSILNTNDSLCINFNYGKKQEWQDIICSKTAY